MDLEKSCAHHPTRQSYGLGILYTTLRFNLIEEGCFHDFQSLEIIGDMYQ